MDFDVPFARGTFRGSIAVPASKSLFQRALILQALSDASVTLAPGNGQQPGEDVRAVQRATAALGRFGPEGLGPDRHSLRLDAHEGGTGFRFLIALATLRRPGARTLITGRPGLLARPHGPLIAALGGLGISARRRRSGSIRVLGHGPRTGPPQTIKLDPRDSSQFASALMLIAPRLGGLDLTFRGPCVSRPYLKLTATMLETFGVAVQMTGLDGPRGRIQVEAGVPTAGTVRIEPDASAAAGLFAAAALTGGCVLVPGLSRSSLQADLYLLDLLARMGASVQATGAGLSVEGPGGRLTAPGTVDLTDATDLLPIVAALAASADGTTTIQGIAHARGKESDRVATSAAAIRALGGDVTIRADSALVIRGQPLSGGTVLVAGDHRIAFGFGNLGLITQGVRLRGAEAVSKSDIGYLAALSRIAAAAD